MADSDIYCTLERPATPQVQEDSRSKLRADFCRLRPSCLVTVALGLLTVILVGSLMCQQILCCGSKHSACTHCPGCPNLWMRNGSHCYFISIEKRDWNSSLEFCADKGSHLLTFLDDEEEIPFREYLGTDFYWIGLRKSEEWRWEDGPVLNLRIFSNSLIQRCGTIHSSGGLQASSCEVPLRWICKKAMN